MISLPVFYINLDKDKNRKENLERECNNLHLAATRIPATLWKALPKAEQDALYSPQRNSKQYHQALVDGEKGCYASHIQAWRQLLASEHPAAVVLEDDVKLAPQLLAAMEAVIALEPAWDMVKLMGRPQEKILAKQPLTASLALIQYSRVPSFTAGYIISRQGAEKLLATRVPFGRPIDIDLRFWWENDLHIYGVHPPVVLLDESSEESTITGRKRSKNLGTRLRKLQMKLQLTLGNARHRRVRPWPNKA